MIHTFPSKLNPTLYRVSGKAIREAIMMSFNEEHIRQSGQGAGFRGSILGVLGFSHNVRISKDGNIIEINGRLLDENRLYTIITDDYLQRGSGYPSLSVDESNALFQVGFIRDVVERNLMNEENYNTASISRFF